MASLKRLLLGTLLAAAPAAAFIGHGIPMYHPLCATACRSLISSATLACTDDPHAAAGHHGATPGTSPACRARDRAFMTTLAWCMHDLCGSGVGGARNSELVSVAVREDWWERKESGDPAVRPEWSYSDALREAQQELQSLGREAPERVWLKKDGLPLNYTARLDLATLESAVHANGNFEAQETLHARYGIVLLVVGFATPIVTTYWFKLPYMTTLLDRHVRPHLTAPLFGTRHSQPLPYKLGNTPTRAQTLYIVLFVVLNVALTAANYWTWQPSTWFATGELELIAYISNRTGVIGYALLPLVVLLSGRNNVLLALTNWSHDTFLLLHRWVARVFVLQALVHSCLELAAHLKMGDYADELPLLYWVWGCVATVAAVAMLVFSVLWLRQRCYEVFLGLHIVLAVFVLAGCWYHVEYLFERKWGYQYWLYAAFAVWGFDRVLRVLRTLKAGVRRARVVDVGGDIMRVDIDGVRWPQAGAHAYITFPTLSWRLWENHPFSVMSQSLLQPAYPHKLASSSSSSSLLAPTPASDKADEISAAATTWAADTEKNPAAATTTASTSSQLVNGAPKVPGICFYIKRQSGLTARLAQHARLLVLLEGPYTGHNSTADALACDRLVVVAGGIGITAVLGHAASHPNTKLYWSMRAEAGVLAQDLAPAVKQLQARQQAEVRVGSRFDVRAVLEAEAADGWATVGVVVCGPPALCDDVRMAVSGGNKGTVFRLAVEAFAW